MKKFYLLLLITIIAVAGCKKKDDSVPVDMSLKYYTAADYPYWNSTTYLGLSFQKNGTVEVSSILDIGNNYFCTLNYTIDDKKAAKTTIRIFGSVDKPIAADGFQTGAKIDWTGTIERLPYKPEVIGFYINGHLFTSR